MTEDQPSRWKPGFRHMLGRTGSGVWRCVDCGAEFTDWPPDSEPCPGPATYREAVT